MSAIDDLLFYIFGYFYTRINFHIKYYGNVEEEWMRAYHRQSLAVLCNPKLVRLAEQSKLTTRTPNWIGA